MGKTVLNSGQLREVQTANFFSGTDIYSISNLSADKFLILNMRIKNSHTLRLNATTWKDGVKLTVVLRNQNSTTQNCCIDVVGCDSYTPVPNGQYADKVYDNSCLIWQFVKAGGALYMILPNTPLYKTTWSNTQPITI